MPYRGYIEEKLAKGLTAQVIWQDLRMELGFSHEYASVKRYVHRLKKRHPEVAGVMEHPPGKEAQVSTAPENDTFSAAILLHLASSLW